MLNFFKSSREEYFDFDILDENKKEITAFAISQNQIDDEGLATSLYNRIAQALDIGENQLNLHQLPDFLEPQEIGFQVYLEKQWKTYYLSLIDEEDPRQLEKYMKG